MICSFEKNILRKFVRHLSQERDRISRTSLISLISLISLFSAKGVVRVFERDEEKEAHLSVLFFSLSVSVGDF
jgi:hypothetical protein